jgi:hypothetical protein
MVYYKAVKQTSKGVLHTGDIGKYTEFEIGRTYVLEGKPKVCRFGFHACRQPLDCFSPSFGYELGVDVLLVVEFVGETATSTDSIKTCGTTMIVKGLATVDVGPWKSFRNGLFYGVANDKGLTSLFHANLLHSPSMYRYVPARCSVKTRQWYVFGKLHRYDDLPAIEDADGTKSWYRHGQLHRNWDRPAVEDKFGGKMWYQHGLKHRDGDLPAVVGCFGQRRKEWWRHGKNHRDGDLPAIERGDGFKAWLIDGVHHRGGDRPAIIHPDGKMEWFIYGVRSREGDRPAIVEADGTQRWYLNGCLGRGNGLPDTVMKCGTKEWHDKSGYVVAVLTPEGRKRWYSTHGSLIRTEEPVRHVRQVRPVRDLYCIVLPIVAIAAYAWSK